MIPACEYDSQRDFKNWVRLALFTDELSNSQFLTELLISFTENISAHPIAHNYTCVFPNLYFNSFLCKIAIEFSNAEEKSQAFAYITNATSKWCIKNQQDFLCARS